MNHIINKLVIKLDVACYEFAFRQPSGWRVKLACKVANLAWRLRASRKV